MENRRKWFRFLCAVVASFCACITGDHELSWLCGETWLLCLAAYICTCARDNGGCRSLLVPAITSFHAGMTYVYNTFTCSTTRIHISHMQYYTYTHIAHAVLHVYTYRTCSTTRIHISHSCSNHSTPYLRYVDLGVVLKRQSQLLPERPQRFATPTPGSGHRRE